MAGKASEFRVSTPGKNLGDHNCRTFDMEEEQDCKDYSDLRTKQNDPATGIKIERIREIVKTEEEFEIDKENKTESRTKKDHFMLYVEWWEKKPTVPKGDADEAPRDFALEGTVSTGSGN